MESFFCDEMLAGLGKWLRAAGYDTAIAERNTDDKSILERAIKEKRILITRDKHFLEMNVPKDSIIFLSANNIEECVQELNEKITLDWLFKPFSRCLLCNSLLREPAEQTILEQAPQDITSQNHLMYCTHCKKLFWEGSHTKRMLEKLKQWQNPRSK